MLYCVVLGSDISLSNMDSPWAQMAGLEMAASRKWKEEGRLPTVTVKMHPMMVQYVEAPTLHTYSRMISSSGILGAGYQAISGRQSNAGRAQLSGYVRGISAIADTTLARTTVYSPRRTDLIYINVALLDYMRAVPRVHIEPRRHGETICLRGRTQVR